MRASRYAIRVGWRSAQPLVWNPLVHRRVVHLYLGGLYQGPSSHNWSMVTIQFSVWSYSDTNYTTCVEPRVELQRGRLHVMHGDLDVSFRP